VPSQQESSRTVQTKTSQTSQQQQQQQRISGNFLPTSATVETTVRSFYPTPRPSPKHPQSSQSVTQHIHVSPDMSQLKSHQITINLPPSDIQRIVQNPSPLLPSQSRVIVTAKASVSDESGRPLNTTQLVTLPLPTIPTSYDDYKEGDESFDPFYRDVPKIRKSRQNAMEKIILREKRSLEQHYHLIYGVDSLQDRDFKAIRRNEPCQNKDNAMNKESVQVNIGDSRAVKKDLKFRDILFSDEDKNKNNTERIEIDSETFDTTSVKQARDNMIRKVDNLEDLKTEASKHWNLNKNADNDEEEEDEETNHEDSSPNVKVNAEKSLDREKHIKDTSELEISTESTTARPRKNKSRGDVIDIIILDSNNDFKEKATSAKTDAPIEIIIEEETKSGTHEASKTDEKVAHRGQIAEYLIKESGKRPNSIGERRQLAVPRETIKRKDAKDSGVAHERKSGPRRKTSRSRSSKRRISSRIRQQRTEDVEVAEAIQQKEDMKRTTTTSTVATTVDITTTTTTTTTIPTTSTTPTTISTSTDTTSTVTSSVADFETKVMEQIDSNIFGELESQTFKELDTRAIGQRDAIYSKSLQDGKSHDASRNKDMERSFDRQIVEDRTRSLELRTDKIEKEKQETESMDYIQNTSEEDTTFAENPRSEKTRSTEVMHVSEEKKSFNEEFTSKEYETLDDEVNMNTNKKETEENLQDGSSKISSDELVTSREGNLEQEELSYHEDTNEKSSTIDILDEESSTANYNEEINSEELNEYQDITELSTESTRSIQEDYREYSENTESSTADYTNFEEYTDSQEDDAVEEGHTEGVLKFTDELPVSDDKEDAETTEESSASNESDAHDYVDDNYEPENYKETEIEKLNESEEDKNEEKDDEEKKDTSTIDLDHTKNIERIDDSAETQTENMPGVMEIEKINLQESLTTTSSTTTASTSMASTTTASTTIASTTMTSITTASIIPASTTTASTTTASNTTASNTTASTTTIPNTTTRPATTTRRRTTTTTRATPPKLFKPTGNKRIYAYTPPTTTPNPVVIKPRLGLYNPKPAKPPKSYNDLAPKPTIRKLILSRKPATTTAATTTIVTTTEKLNTENPEMTTEPVAATITTTATTIPAMTTTATSIIATTTAATTMTTVTTMTPATTVAATTTMTTESIRKESGLENKLAEANEHISLYSSAENDQTNKENQLSSPSEQNTPINSSKNVDPEITTMKIEAFTPYPLSRLSTFASSVEQTTKEMDVKPQETTEDIDILMTTIPPTTLLFEKSEYAEIIPNTEKYLEIAETTIASTSEVYQQETSSISSVPPVPERATSASVFATTILPKAEDTDSVASMEAAIFRSSDRKFANPRKHASFNCLEREMYRFYGDFRDCRLFHYCSPGFNSRQVLDFRFVCEKGTTFDEETQSCRHDVPNRKCRNRSW